MRIPRIYDNLDQYLKPNKVVVIYGPRQVGKTTLLKHFLSQTSLKYRFDSGDNIRIQNLLGSQDFNKIIEYAQGYDLIVIDEAQRIKDIGHGLKILVDNSTELQIIATGSSSFELAGQIGEPLTGRKITLKLYPISFIELSELFNKYDLKEKLEEFLIFGFYPEVITAENRTKKIGIIDELVNSYLLKDILELDKVKSSKILLDLLRLIAFQIGKEVSLSELAQKLGIDYKTVARYLDLLEKTFIIRSLRGFRRNLRIELTKKAKYYFFDTGIRNALIANFNSFDLRNDIGMLWENFLFIERLKKQQYHSIYANNYFWRTWSQKEIDFIEERDGKLYGFEFKWNVKKKVKVPKEWIGNYPESEFSVITPDNFLDIVI
jgi:predicted AAA+ superfamily ATPase